MHPWMLESTAFGEPLKGVGSEGWLVIGWPLSMRLMAVVTAGGTFLALGLVRFMC